MERLAKEKISAQQKLGSLRNELSNTLDPIQIAALLAENNAIARSRNGVSFRTILVYKQGRLITINFLSCGEHGSGHAAAAAAPWRHQVQQHEQPEQRGHGELAPESANFNSRDQWCPGQRRLPTPNASRSKSQGESWPCHRDQHASGAHEQK